MLKNKLLLAALALSFGFGSAFAADEEGHSSRNRSGSHSSEGGRSRGGSVDHSNHGSRSEGRNTEKSFAECKQACAAHNCEEKAEGIYKAEACFNGCKSQGLLVGGCAFVALKTHCIEVNRQTGKTSFFKDDNSSNDGRAKFCRHASQGMSAYGLARYQAKGEEEIAKDIALADKIKEARHMNAAAA